MRGYRDLEILRVNGNGQKERTLDDVAEESRLVLKVNGQEILKLLCSPTMVRELVVGFLVTEGVIDGAFCVERMSIEYSSEGEIIVDVPAEGQVRTPEQITITSGCVGGISFSVFSDNNKIIPDGPKIDREAVLRLYKVFQDRSDLYKRTGCVHSAAISNLKSILLVAEDIGRHNAVDKAIGYCILENISFDDKIILVSGRLSSEMVRKAAAVGIPIVISRTAPTTRAVEIAKDKGITLIGFMRGKRFNIYSDKERII